MQANKLLAFKDVKSDKVDAIVNPFGEVYFYFACNKVDCIVSRMHRSTKGITLTISGSLSGGGSIDAKCTHHKDVLKAVKHVVETLNSYL